MLKKSLLFFAILLLSLSSILAGCSSKSEKTANEGEGDKVTLEWWSHDGPAFIKANKQFIADYEKANPNIKIELKIFPYDAFIQKLKASYASKKAPDIAQVFGSWVPQYAKNGLLAEVPAEDSSWVQENFYEPALGAYTRDGKLYGIPHEYNLENGGMLVHPEMFEKAGLEYPKTWNELVETAKMLTVKNGNKLGVKGFDFISYDNIMFTFLSMILQQNAAYLTEDGHVDFSTPEAVKAMTELKNFVTDYKVTDLSDFGNTDTQDLFFKKKAAMVIRGPWTIAIGKENYKTEDFGYEPVPSFTDNDPFFAAESGWGEIVAKQSKHQEEAWKFVRYMSEQKQAHYFNISTFSVPANKQVAEDPSFVEESPLLKASIEVLPFGKFIGHGIDTDFLKKQTNDQFQLIVAGKISVEDGLKKIEEEVNKMIDKQ